MGKRIPAKVRRYMDVMRQLKDAKSALNSTSGRWSVTEPWSREEASELQKHLQMMMNAKRVEIDVLRDAWCEFIEMVDDGCVEEYTEFTRAQMRAHEAMVGNR